MILKNKEGICNWCISKQENNSGLNYEEMQYYSNVISAIKRKLTSDSINFFECKNNNCNKKM